MARFYDTILGEYIKNPGVKGISLDKLSGKDFNYLMMSYDYVTDKGEKNFKDVDLPLAAIYSGEDVYITNKLFEKQKSENLTENNILKNIEIPLIDVLKNIELNGVKIDRDRLKEIGNLLQNEIILLEKEIYKLAEEDFNINSPKKVGEILFGKLGLPSSKKTKTGWSVSAEVLGDLAHKYPIAQMIVDYRHYSKILSTYVDGLLNIVSDDDLVHTNYNQTVTTTGRLSSTNPNLQNIPSSSGIAGEIRSAFISRFENGKVLSIDYSQVEVRILAILSKDKNLLEAFKNNLDIHHKTAEFLFPGETITPSKRKIAKSVNFGVIYGISPFGLSKMIGGSVSESKNYIDTFFNSYPKVREFLDETIKNCEKNLYVETIFGRKRFINGINDKNKIIKQAAEREAINMPVQGTSADIIKLAMIKTQEFLEKNKLKSKMIMQVHDELVFDVFPGEEEQISKNIKNIMENILENSEIILKADVSIGKNWKEAK
ncbi:hypothetical protein BKN14_01415 [Candidatus Gracilibacteria bacterium HOT-871]|nr:hypothetical protein BKN14_01415 [Candidatus Gracilibacteria bacterium HOT-871]